MTVTTDHQSDFSAPTTGLRVLHLPGSYQPWVTGGKEIYTHSLARELQRLGCSNHVVFHQTPGNSEPLGEHQYEGISVHVLPAIQENERTVWYSNRTKETPGFADILNRIKPDIVHLHDFGRDVNLRHLEQCQSSGAKTVMTYHSPGQSCLQREMLFGGTTVCDGEIKLDRCTECRLAVQGIPSYIRKPLSKLSLPLKPVENKLSRALTSRQMTAHFASAWKDLVARIDAIHVQAHWIVDVMKINNVPEEKIAYFRSGLPLAPFTVPARSRRQPGTPLKVIMLGRCEIIKGQETLIDAVQRLPSTAMIEVSFFGSYWETTPYGQRCLAKIQGDARFHPPRKLPHQEIVAQLATSDLLAVPSHWMETGPLVVLEAFALQVPVVGSNRGGIAELVQHGVNGLLFETGNIHGLQSILQNAIDKPELLEDMRSNITPPRLMADTAADTATLYRKLIASRND